MKIGILTQPLHNNYGGLLQNYALQQVFKQMGHDVETIDHVNRKVSLFHNVISFIKAWLLHVLNPSKYDSPTYIPTTNEMITISTNTRAFVDKYIKRTHVLQRKTEFDRIASTRPYDVYVVGSDQCWRLKYNGSIIEEMFLRFVEKQTNIKRISYAASFGSDKWEMNPKTTKRCAYLVKKFNLVTVREKSGIRLCKDYLGINAIHVLDPTLLLDASNYKFLVEVEKEDESNGDLLYIFLNPSQEKKSIIKEIATQKGLTPFTVLPKYQAENLRKKDVRERINDCIYPTVTSWIRGFMDTKMVITDSFHGIVFSVIFNKPFWVIGNENRGNARFESLLDTFNLTNRMITIDHSNNINWDEPIEWVKVNSIWNDEKNRCLKIIRNCLTDKLCQK